MAIFGTIEDLKPLFSKTQELESLFINIQSMFSKENLLKIQSLEVGENYKLEFDYGIFCIAHCYRLKDQKDAFFESHQEYVDFQVVVDGFEGYLIGDYSSFNLFQSYDKEKDLAVYEPKNQLSYLRLSYAQMAILFPTDIHGVGIGHAEEIGRIVRKVIFKVPIKYIKHRL